jgi:CDP-6-deoxy-D-xylo-4-hexulose-3-dehydrase
MLKNYKPIFVDINKETLQIDEDKIESEINKNTSAIMVPNLIGNIPNWKKIFKISKKYNLKIIEDSADTMAPKIDNKNTSNYSDVTICSFYGSHLISCAGNGGIIMMNNSKFYNKAKILRSWGRSSSILRNQEDITSRLKIKLDNIQYDKKFVFSGLGYNFEPSEISAAFGLEQLKKINKFKMLRNKNFLLHQKFIKKYPKIFIPIHIEKNVQTQFLAYPIILKKNLKFSRKKLQIFLEENQIQTRPIFSGNSLRHPAFSVLKNKRNNVRKFINSDYIMKYGLLIGCHQGLTEQMIKYIHIKIEQFVTK